MDAEILDVLAGAVGRDFLVYTNFVREYREGGGTGSPTASAGHGSAGHGCPTTHGAG